MPTSHLRAALQHAERSRSDTHLMFILLSTTGNTHENETGNIASENHKYYDVEAFSEFVRTSTPIIPEPISLPNNIGSPISFHICLYILHCIINYIVLQNLVTRFCLRAAFE